MALHVLSLCSQVILKDTGTVSVGRRAALSSHILTYCKEKQPRNTPNCRNITSHLTLTKFCLWIQKHCWCVSVSFTHTLHSWRSHPVLLSRQLWLNDRRQKLRKHPACCSFELEDGDLTDIARTVSNTLGKLVDRAYACCTVSNAVQYDRKNGTRPSSFVNNQKQKLGCPRVKTVIVYI